MLFKDEIVKLLSSYKIIYSEVLSQLKEAVEFIVERLRADNSEYTCPGCFEVYGLDFIIDMSGRVFILEINENPEFKITSEAKFNTYKAVLEELMATP